VPAEVKRSARVSAILVKELAWLLTRTVKDPRVGFVALTRAVMPDDLRSAKVMVRLVKDGDDPARRREALAGLKSATGLLRKEASRRMGLRVAPELTFVYDDGQDDVTRIEALLEEVRVEERSRGRGRE
jgi:ribosome-binding factor A